MPRAGRARPLAALDANASPAETADPAASKAAAASLPVPPSPFFASTKTAVSTAPALPGLLPRPPPAVRTFVRNIVTQDPPRAASLGLTTPSPVAEQHAARPAAGPSRFGGGATAAAPTPPPAGTRWAAAATTAPAPAPAHRQDKGPALAAAPRGGVVARVPPAARPAASPAYWARLFRELDGEELKEDAPTPPAVGGGVRGGAAAAPAPAEPSAAASAPTVGGGGPSSPVAGERSPPVALEKEGADDASVAAPAPAPSASPAPAESAPAAQQAPAGGRVTRRAAAAAAAAAAPPAAPSPPLPSPPAAEASAADAPPLPDLDPALAAAADLVATPSTVGGAAGVAAAAAPSPSPSAPPAVEEPPRPASPELEGSATPAVPPPAAAEPTPAPQPPRIIETVIVRDEDWPATPSDVVFVGGAGSVGGGPASPTASPPSTLFARAAAGGGTRLTMAAGPATTAARTGLPRAGAFGLSRRMTTTAARPSVLPGSVRPSLAFGGGAGRASLLRVPQPAFPLGPMGAARAAADAAAASRPSVVAPPPPPLPPRPPSMAPSAAQQRPPARPPSAARAPPPRTLPTPGARVPRPVLTPRGGGPAGGPPSPVGDLMARLHLTPSPGGSGGSTRTARRRPPSPLAGPAGAVKPEPAEWSPEAATSTADAAPAAPPTPLAPGEAMARLLTLAGQDPDAAADPATLLPSMDELLELHVGGKAVAGGGRAGDPAVTKVGEGTYGEAFRLGGAVVKVVPIDGGPLPGWPDDAQKTAAELLAEAEISLALTALRDPLLGAAAPPEVQGAADASAGFGATTAVGVCWGAYSNTLVRAWRAWKAAHGSDNPDPGTAYAGAKRQAFVLLFGCDGGEDLEAWAPASAAEVRSVLLQATLALAVGERALAFEHRDLHWGNVLVARAPPGARPPAARLAGADISLPGAAGLVVTLIDFTLSRLAGAGGGVAFCDLNADPALFAGPRGDAQAETYRRMRRAVRGDWSVHAPATNALWLHYLADVFCSAKAPPPGAGPDEGRALRGFRRRALAAPSAGALLHDEYFAGAWVAKAPTAERG